MLKEYNCLMPPEWEKHERTFISWPVMESLVYPNNYKEVCEGYAEVAKAVSHFEPVTMLVNADTAEYAKRLCGDFAELIKIPHNDAWIRDNGPTFVLGEKRKLAGINWKFNAWGEKYMPYNLDEKVASKILEHYNVPVLNAPIVLEGGSIHTDGEGTLLTTEQCLLNPNRNPDLTKIKIEEELKRYLGISKLIWLKKGLSGDETDGHVDNIACFACAGTVIIQVCSDKNDENYAIANENLEILSNMTDAKERKLQIIEIEQPPVRLYKGKRLTLSYLNFYFVNGGIILPIFGGEAAKTDRNALDILKKVFPDREIACVDGMPLIKEGGNIHCITQQMPEGIRLLGGSVDEKG